MYSLTLISYFNLSLNLSKFLNTILLYRYIYLNEVYVYIEASLLLLVTDFIILFR